MKSCPLCETSYPSHHSTCPTDGALLIESHELEPGTVIRGKYRILSTLGSGAMGTVYLAEHMLLGRRRALKFISPELAQNAAFLRRFRREAQAAIELRHPNVVEVVDLDQAEDGTPYIAMEYIEGQDLRHALSQAAQFPDSDRALYQGTTSVAPQKSQNESGVLTPEGCFLVERALAIARGIALGLGAAHAKGIIHRDIKPENILLATAGGEGEIPKLLDFGIAAMKESATAVSRTRVPMLTPDYAAPEQWRGMAAEELDGRADLYALGGVLNEMLTGSTSFHAHNTEGWMYQHLNEEPQPPSRLRPELANWPGLDELVLRLLAKDRELRPGDADEVVVLLDGLRYVAPSSRRITVREERPHPTTVEMPAREIRPAPRPNAPSRPEPAKKNQKKDAAGSNWVLWLIVIGALVLAGFAVWWWNAPPAGVSTSAGHSDAIEKQADDLASQKRYSEAIPLYEQACNDGNGTACNMLGVHYLDGFGVAKDSLSAAAWYNKACDANDSTGCMNLAGLYRDGTGVKKDKAKARELLIKSCNLADDLACGELKQLH